MSACPEVDSVREIPPGFHDAVRQELSRATAPPDITELRLAVAARLAADPDVVREFVFRMIRSGALKLTPNRKIYR